MKKRIVKNEKKYQEFIDASLDAFVSADAQMKITLWNKAAEKIFGYKEKEILGKSLMKIVPKDLRVAKKKGFARFKKTGKGPAIGNTLELRGLRKDGKMIPIELSVSSKTIGEELVVMAVIRDITKRKKAEQYLKTILDFIPAGIALIDAKTHIISDINPAAARMIGISKEKIVGNICHRYICPAKKGKCPITDLGQKVDNAERVLLGKDRKKVPILKTVASVTIDRRKYLLESFVDITKQKEAEEALNKKVKELEKINKLMVGRELKMIELKKEIAKITIKINQYRDRKK